MRSPSRNLPQKLLGSALLLIFALMQISVHALPPLPKSDYKRISFRTLRLYIPGRTPPSKVQKLNNKKVELLGFLAATNSLEDMEEFVLSATPPLNCYCHPAMRNNETIMVHMNGGKKIDYRSGIVKVRGTLRVATDVKSEYDDVMYTLECDEVI